MRKSLIFKVVALTIIQLVTLLVLNAYGLFPKYLIIAVVFVMMCVVVSEASLRIYEILKSKVNHNKKCVFDQVDLLSKIAFNPNLESSTRDDLIKLLDIAKNIKDLSGKEKIGIIALNKELEKLQQSVNTLSAVIINEILSAESRRNIIPGMISDITGRIHSIDWLMYPIDEDNQTKSYTNIAMTKFEQAKGIYSPFDRSTHPDAYKLLVETLECLAKADYMRMNQDERKATTKEKSSNLGLLIDFDFRRRSNSSIH